MLVLKLSRVAIVAVAVAGVVAPTAPAAATKTICVGLVVDARPLGGPAAAQCTTVPDGSTGYDVLRSAGHHVGFRQDGIICTIDNRPADGCAKTDALHYWAYFHREPKSSSWSYSNEGATTYKPDNGETEGWVWRDGDMATPKDVPYSAICPQSSSPSPSPRPTATHATPAAETTASTTPSPPAVQPRHRHAKRQKHTASPTPTATTAATTSSPPVTIAAVSSKPHDGSSGPPWGLILGAAAVVGIGGAAGWQWRRREAE